MYFGMGKNVKCHKCPAIYLFSWEREGILMPQTLYKAIKFASAFSDLTPWYALNQTKASMMHLKIAQST